MASLFTGKVLSQTPNAESKVLSRSKNPRNFYSQIKHIHDNQVSFPPRHTDFLPCPGDTSYHYLLFSILHAFPCKIQRRANSLLSMPQQNKELYAGPKYLRGTISVSAHRCLSLQAAAGAEAAGCREPRAAGHEQRAAATAKADYFYFHTASTSNRIDEQIANLHPLLGSSHCFFLPCPSLHSNLLSAPLFFAPLHHPTPFISSAFS